MAAGALAPQETPAALALAVAPGRPQRLAFALMLALFAVAGAAAVWSFVWPSQDPWLNVGLIEDFPPGTVTSFRAVLEVDGREGFHIVRLDDGELLALVARLPHPNPDCVVGYRPDFVFLDRTGWFFEPCRNEVYDMVGYRVLRRWPRDLDRLAVKVRDGVVYVDPHAITPGARQPLEGYEFQTGGTLLSPHRY